jgi:hypothetical protein
MTNDAHHPLPPDVLTEPPKVALGRGTAVLEDTMTTSPPTGTPPPPTEPPD